MTDNISAFPQRKPSIRAIVMDVAKPNMPGTVMMTALSASVREHYPDMPPEQIEADLRAEIAVWDAQLGKADFWDDFDAAAALDPDWYETENRSTCCRPGALHDTPQKLVAAYRVWNERSGR